MRSSILPLVLSTFCGLFGTRAFAQTTPATLETGGYYISMAVDDNDNIYLSRFNATTKDYEVVKYTNGTGSPTVIYSGLGYDGVNYSNDYPWGMAVASNGDVFVVKAFPVSEGQIVKLTAPGYTATVIQQGRYFSAIALDAQDNLYAMEYESVSTKYQIVKYNAATLSGAGTVIYNGLPLEDVNAYPWGLAVAADGDIYFSKLFGADKGGLLKLTAPAYNLSTIETGGYHTALAVDSDENVYATKSNGENTGLYSLVKYSGGAGTPTVLFNKLTEGTQFFPWGIAVQKDKDIYISDGAEAGGGTVWIWSPPAEPPVLVIDAGSPTYTEDGAAVAIAPNLTLSDSDSPDMSSATITVQDNIMGDVLAFTDQNGITGSFNAAIGTLTLNGTASIAFYQAALRSITYSSTNNNPASGVGNADRVIDIRVNDGGLSSAAGTTKTVAVANTNDAPVLDSSQSPSLTTIPEDFNSIADGSDEGSTLVSSLLAGVSDVDAEALQGIAIIGASAQGNLWYSTNNGANWYQVPTVSPTAAFLLQPDDRLRFQPAYNYAGTITDVITFRAWDRTSAPNLQGSANVTVNGGTTAFSAATDQVSVTVTPINDAPTINAGPLVLLAGDEISRSPGNKVSDILSNLNRSDVDAAAVGGIAITAVSSASGSWQYSTDGGNNWYDMGSLSSSTGLLLDANAQISVLGNNSKGGTASISFRAWDRTSGTATSGSTRSLADVTSYSGSTPFSFQLATASIAVEDINTSPRVTAPLSIAVTEDVSSALTGISFSDVDAAGESLTSTFTVASGSLTATSAAGVTVSGTSNVLVLSGTIADLNAFIAASQLSFITANNATTDIALGIAINDGGNIGSGGAKTGEVSLSLSVNGVNDAPVLANTDIALTTITEDLPAPTNGSSAGSTSVSALLGGITDVDNGALHGVAITGISNQAGLWYSLDNGANWTAAPSVSAANALLLNADALLYFVPAANFNGILSTALSFRAWDQSSGSNGSLADVTSNGGSTAFSTATDLVSLTVSEVNDAPAVFVPLQLNVVEDEPSVISGISFSDLDAGTAAVVVSFTADAGSLSANSSQKVSVGGSASTLTLSGSIAEINTFIAGNGLSYTTAANATQDINLRVSINDGGNTGSGGALSGQGSILLSVSAVNDAPLLSAPLSQEVLQNSSLVLSNTNGNAVVVSDVDAGGVAVKVSLSATNGKLSLASVTGLTIIAGSGSDNSSMEFTGTLANINAAFNGLSFQPANDFFGAASVTISLDDQGNLGSGGAKTTTAEISIDVLNVPAVISALTLPVDGLYKTGDVLTFSAQWSKAVVVSPGVELPAIELIIGSQTVEALYQAATSGSKEMVFTYTIAEGLEDGDGLTLGTAIELKGASILDAAGDSAEPELPNVPSAEGILVDAIRPLISSVSVPAAGHYAAGKVLYFALQLSEKIAVNTTGGMPGLSLRFGNGSRTASYLAAESSDEKLVFAYTIAAGDTDADGIEIAAEMLLNGAVVNDFGGNALVLTLDGVAATDQVIIDTNPPATPLILSMSEDTGSDAADGITMDQGLSFAGTAEAGAMVQLYSGATPLASVAATEDGSWTIDYTATTLAAGSYSFTATATDQAGNSSVLSQVHQVVIDIEAPQLVLQEQIVQLDASGSAEITAAQLDNGSTDNTGIVQWTLDRSSFSCAETGPQTVVVRAEDAAGNLSSASVMVRVEDKIAPSLTVQNVGLELDAAGTATLTEADVVLTKEDNCGQPTIQFSKSAFSCADIVSNTVSVSASDASGNTSTQEVLVQIKDGTAPAVLTKDIVVELNANGAASILPAAIDGGSADNCTPLASLQLSIDQSSFSCADVGENEVQLSVSDAYGNSSTATAIVTVVDKMAPTAITRTITIELDADGQATISAEQLDNGSSDNCGILSRSLSKSSFSCSDLGDNEVVLSLQDAAGNTSSATAIVRVEDRKAPTIIAQEISLQLDANGQASLRAAQLDNGSFDNCGIISYVLDRSSFSCADIGANTIRLTATDASGNKSTAEVVVKVEDRMAPLAAFKNVRVLLDAAGQATVSVSQLDNGSSDNCGIASIVLGKSSFSCADIGENNLSLTITDLSGNQTKAEAVVTVAEEIAPQIQKCPADRTVTINALSNYSLPDFSSELVASDNCAVVSISQLPVPGTVLSQDGQQQEVQLLIKDASGNEVSCSFNLNVRYENSAPSALLLSANTLQEHQPSGSFIGNLSAEDPDADDVISYKLLAGEGAADNALFYLQEGALYSNQSFDYEVKSSYTIRMAATDAAGASFESDYTIMVEGIAGEERAYLPNLFSPNGDGNNDFFKLRANGLEKVSFRIFNRFGNLVYETSDIRQATEVGWDGTYNGKEQPSGSYVWQISGNFTDGTEITFNKKKAGNIALIR